MPGRDLNPIFLIPPITEIIFNLNFVIQQMTLLEFGFFNTTWPGVRDRYRQIASNRSHLEKIFLGVSYLEIQ